MPRISLWRQQKSNDYRFIDRQIREMYQVGGLDIFIHKYLGVNTGPTDSTTVSTDATLPKYNETNPLFIEDLLFLENRNRDYDENVYEIRGIFNVHDLDYTSTQFALFLKSDVLFITFHYNDMIDYFGRKLMNGDVLEIPNFKDYHPLNSSIPKALPKFYVVNEASFASEGFSPTWYPHLWRVKTVPLVGAQEYKDILNNFIDQQGDINGDDGTGNGYGTLSEYMSTCAKNLNINDAIVEQAENDVPYSGYDVQKFYVLPPNPEYAGGVAIEGSNISILADSTQYTSDLDVYLPPSDGYYVGYLTGDSLPPNGSYVTAGSQFPSTPLEGDYCLRTDYTPNRLFQYNGYLWIKIEDNVRTELTPGPDNKTQRSEFVNNTDILSSNDRGDIPSRQSLSDLLKPEADN